jgi:hypothetical protein
MSFISNSAVCELMIFDYCGRSLINSGLVEAHEERCLCTFIAASLIHYQEGNIRSLLCYNSAL